MNRERLLYDLQRIRRLGYPDLVCRPQVYPHLWAIIVERMGTVPDDLMLRRQRAVTVFKEALDELPTPQLRAAAAILFHLDTESVAPPLNERRQRADHVASGTGRVRTADTIQRTLEKDTLDPLILCVLSKTSASAGDIDAGDLLASAASRTTEDATKRRDALTGGVGLLLDVLGGPAPSFTKPQTPRAAALVALRLPSVVRHAFAETKCPLHAADQIERVRESCDQFFVTQDAAHGGQELCALAKSLYERVDAWLRSGRHTSAVANALQILRVSLGLRVSWLLFDSGRTRAAYRYARDCALSAHYCGHAVLEAHALAQTALMATKSGYVDDALLAARAGHERAAAESLPALSALLCLREATAYATKGDAAAFNQAIQQSRSHLEQQQESVPVWLKFMNEGEILGLSGYGLSQLGREPEAACAYRAVLDHKATSRRNGLYYQALLAQSLAAQGDLEEAARLGIALVQDLRTHGCGSRRVSTHLRTLHSSLAQARALGPVAQEFVHGQSQV